jgi:hypothetical protein
MKTSSRREFFKLVSLVTLVATFGQKIWAEGLALIDMSKTKRKDTDNEKAVNVATGLGYVEDADKGEKAGKIKRMEKTMPDGKKVPPGKQYCNNCMFFDQTKVGGNDNGSCQIIPGVLVHNKGYCNTYTPSPKAKV